MPKKKTPKLGEEIVDPLNTPVVEDPASEVASEAPPEPPKSLASLMKEMGMPFILIEDGEPLPVPGGQEKEWRVHAEDGTVYEHVSEDSEGNWIYRKS